MLPSALTLTSAFCSHTVFVHRVMLATNNSCFCQQHDTIGL